MARIAFCQNVMVEYMGYMQMSAVLKAAGHVVEVFFDPQDRRKSLIHELKAFGPDIVGFSVLTPGVAWALATGCDVHQEIGALTIAGSVHAMLNPEELINHPGMDMVCIGEGEDCLLELCKAIDTHAPYDHIEGLWVRTEAGIQKNPAQKDLVAPDRLPYIDRRMYDKYRFFKYSPYLRVMAGRGCPFRCAFCSNGVLTDHFGGPRKYIRKRSPLKAVEEIKFLVARRPRKVKYIIFTDEVLWVETEWLEAFLGLYKKEIGIPFMANLNLGNTDEKTIRLLADAGAKAVSLSTETADETQRRDLLNKPVTDKRIFHIAALLKKHHIMFGSSVFFGLPGDTVDDHLRHLAFFRRLKPTYLWTAFFQPYPGLPLTKDPAVAAMFSGHSCFQSTLHHDMVLNLPDRDRLTRLKKVYYLMYRFPFLEAPLKKLIGFNVPLLFDVLFMSHFTFYMFVAEKISFSQFLFHLKTFGLTPLLKGHASLQRCKNRAQGNTNRQCSKSESPF